MKKTTLIFVAIFLLFLTSCNSIFLVKNRLKYANDLVKNSDFKSQILATDYFSLFSFQKIQNPKNKILNVYFEGDGFAWKTKYQLSKNPTPLDPIALKMALQDNSENVLYLARPCQFIDLNFDLNCRNQEFWSRARFSLQVIDSENQAVEKIKEQYGFKKVNLFGFSGGGAVAILVAVKRKDVESVKTIAANLDHEKLSKIHNATPLSQSLNPIDFAKATANITQLHLAGGQDETVPYPIIESFVNEVNNYSFFSKKAQFQIIKKANHEYEKWPQIWSEIINRRDISYD